MVDSVCIGCGCTDDHACVKDGVPCHWLAEDQSMGIGVCSNCSESIVEFERRQKELVELAGVQESVTVEVKVEGRGEELLYFFGFREIEKPKLLTVPVGDEGEYIAFSEHGLGNKRFLFTQAQLGKVDNMTTVPNPKWVI